MSKLNVNRIRDLLQEFDFQQLFVDELGWNNPSQRQSQAIQVGDEIFTYKGVAVLGGIEVFEVKSASGLIPPRQTQHAISKEVSKARLEHVLIFVDKKRTQSVWFWVKRDGSKRFPREHHFFKGQPGDLFISKIATMAVDLSELDDSGQFPLLEAAKKVQRALDIERVIKKFFKDYDDQRVHFTKLICGIPDEKDRRWYASVLLNRLMFIYFLQKKMFIDGGDGSYLENKLAQSKTRGKDRYYSEFLQALFFEAFAKPEAKRTAESRRFTGKVKYLNGGLFLPHKLEQKYTIAVPDEAFEELFGLFGRYSWNLNDIPGESDDDINPDVLGYIFEKYINQKEFGAYYTRPEITEYLCEQTIFRLILDKVGPEIPELGLAKQYHSVPDLLIKLDRSTAVKLIKEVLPGISILDPAVGSGAFLVAALKTLITVYSAVTGWLQYNAKDDYSSFLRDHGIEDASKVGYAIKKAIITNNLYGVDLMEEATEIAKLRLFMTLVASAKSVDDLEPLPNIDFNILAGNSLIGLMRVEDVVSDESKMSAQIKLLEVGKTLQELSREREIAVRRYQNADPSIGDLKFLRDDVDRIEKEATPALNHQLRLKMADLDVKFEEATWDEKKWDLGKSKKRAVNGADIEALEPFHWGFEFDQILHQRGGFDAIITNPPWETLKPISREFCYPYSPDANRRLSTAKEFDTLLKELVEDDTIRADYLKYLSQFPHQSAYFRSAPEYANQSAVVAGKKTGTDINLYKLFVERCYHLLRPQGLCGIVIPSGIYSDLGTTGLRKLLFSSATVTGLFCFENRRGLFDGVDSRFKFVVLSYQKGGNTQAFPAAFMRLDVADLSRFPESVGMNITMETVKALSPDTWSVVEFQSPQDAQISDKMMRYPALGEEIDGKWQLKLANEFHMTADAKLFGEPGPGKIVLYEGKMIWHFTHQYADGRYFVDEKAGRKSILGRTKDEGQVLDYQRYRFAHRSITGNANERTMVCSILPKNVFYGHSLNASKRKGYSLSESELLFLTALMSSFTVDYALRQRVATQLTMFFVYQIPVPRLTKSDSKFAPIVRRAARLICTTEEFADLWNEVDADLGLNPAESNPRPGKCPWTKSVGATEPHVRSTLRSELDALIAHLYGLTEEEFRHVLSTFPLVDPGVKDAALAAYRSVSAGRIQ